MTELDGLEVIEADLSDPGQAAGFLALMNHYAMDSMGAGRPMTQETIERLVPAIVERNNITVFLARVGSEVVGIANCIEGFSTFAARPVMNLHDLAVHESMRGRGIGRRLLTAVAEKARELSCCKLTLEVLERNERAQRLYLSFGFEARPIDAPPSRTLFWQIHLT
jgi:ribosomal protein S18 acetylase RimI-like enzyme